MKEDRRAKRIQVPLMVAYRPVNSTEWRQVTQGQSLSLTGVSFQLAEAIPVGTEITIRVGVVGDQKEVTATGKVVWVRPAQVRGQHPFIAGLEFTQIDPEAARLLLEAAYQYWHEVLR